MVMIQALDGSNKDTEIHGVLRVATKLNKNLMKKELEIVTNALLSGRKDPIFIFIRFSFTASA